MSDYRLRVHGNIVKILGSQLIDELSVAVLELVKNAYDADATRVKITLDQITDPSRAMIIVEDNGHGMTESDIRNRWLVAGYSDKAERVLRKELTPKGRFPLGRMGIGRFAAARLGNQLVMATRAANYPEYIVRISWDELGEAADLSETLIDVQASVEPRIFTGTSTGTRIAIRQLPEPWTRDDLLGLRTQLRRFTSPHLAIPDFQIQLSIPQFPEYEDLQPFKNTEPSHFYCEARIDERGECLLSWKNHITRESDTESVNLFRRISNEYRADRKQPDCGPFSMILYAWKGSKAELKKLGIHNPSYLEEITGISIFRDGFRVLPYGDPGHDWLDLNMRRVNRPTERFSTNRILGSVSISSENNPLLQDQANRLGMIENQAYRDFKLLCLGVIGTFEDRVLRQRSLAKQSETDQVSSATTPQPTGVGHRAPTELVSPTHGGQQRFDRLTDLMLQIDKLISEYQDDQKAIHTLSRIRNELGNLMDYVAKHYQL